MAVELIHEERTPALVTATTRLLAPLDGWLDRLADSVTERFRAHLTPRPGDIEPIRELLTAMLGELHPLIKGCGFMAARDAVAGARLHQEWWQASKGTFVRLLLDFDDSSDSFYDYTLKEYFAVPARTRLPHIEGPYVDYLGIDEYIFTWGKPIVIGDRLVGVVGADMPLEALQQRLLDEDFEEEGARVLLINGKGRVILSSDAATEPGSMVRSTALAEWFATEDRRPARADGMEMWPCESVPWAVVVLRDGRPVAG